MIPGDIARNWLERGVQPIPVPYKSKSPTFRGWQNLRLTLDDLPSYFDGRPQNVGGLWGAPSGGIVDVDFDAPEAVAAWPQFAPATDLVFGRPGNPSSHWLYRVGPSARTRKWRDPTLKGKKAMLIEFRSTGHQSLLPGSMHPENELYEFEHDGQPGEVDEDALVRELDRTAAVALLARYWPAGSRHDAALAFSGGLAKDGIPVQDAERLMRAVTSVANDHEFEDRLRAVHDSYDQHEKGQLVSGWGTLADCIDRRVLDKVRGWIGSRLTQTPPGGDLRTTELGNAERLIRQHGQDLRYCEAWGSWLEWDSRRWKRVGSRAIKRRAIEVVRSIYEEAANPLLSDPARRILGAWALTSESERQINAMVSLASTLPGVAVEPDELDVDEWLLNVQNGTIDLTTGDLRSHERDDLITKLAPVHYDPDAPCPRWDDFLERVQPDHDVRDYLRKSVGYSATGTTRERAMFMPFGTGANGKSTFLDTLAKVLGDYAQQVPPQTLLARGREAIPNDIARLQGVRFATAVETDEGKRLNEAQIKQLTGDHRVVARFLHKEWFEFKPQAKIWLATNHKPLVRGADKGIWDRLKLIDFAVRIPEDEWDRTLDERLLEERSGILGWIVRGCLEWQAQPRLIVPESVRTATESYRHEMDVLLAFLEDECDVDPRLVELADVFASDFKVMGRDLYARYAAWCKETGEYSISNKAFAPRLEERGFKSKRETANKKWWYGLQLKPIEVDSGLGLSMPSD